MDMLIPHVAADLGPNPGRRHGDRRDANRRETNDALKNTEALAEKLQHLLDSSRHENDALRTECEALRDALNSTPVGGEPDLESVPLADLILHAGLFLEAGQSLTIHPGEHCSVRAFDHDFVCHISDARDLLAAAATLARCEVPA